MQDDPLLYIEANHDVWQAQIDGIHLWSLIRFPILRSIYFDKLSYVSIKPEKQRLVLASPKRWRRYGRTLRFFRSRKPYNTPLLIAVTNHARYPAKNNPSYSFDRLFHPFYDYARTPLIAEDSMRKRWYPPDEHYESHIISQDIMLTWNLVKAKFGNLSSKKQRFIEDYADFITTIYDVPDKKEPLVTQMNGMLLKYNAIRSYYEFLARRVTTKVAVIAIGNYMMHVGLAIKTLHEAGFHVIEHQHGLIHDHHYAYNFPSEHTQNPAHVVHTYTPDTFLAYGDYWKTVSNIPGDYVTMGYPYFTDFVEQVRSESEVKTGQILMISASANPTFDEIIKAVAEQYPERPILYKLHPRQLHMMDHYTNLFQDVKNVTIIGQVDVYQLVAQSEIIVSYDGSTVLIEATAFPNKRIFYHDDNLIPKEVGEHYEDAAHLIELVSDSRRGRPQVDPDVFYVKDWQPRLNSFFEHLQEEGLMWQKS